MIGQIIEELKKINKKNYEVESITAGELKLYMKMTPEEFQKFIEWVRSKGYVNVNGAVNRLTDYIDYKEDYILDEYEHLKTGKKILLEYIRVKSKEEYVVLKSITVE